MISHKYISPRLTVSIGLFLFLSVTGTSKSIAQNAEKNSVKLLHHSFYLGSNLKLAPIDNFIEIDQSRQIDPVWPGATSYLIKPTGSIKIGYGLGLRITQNLFLNSGLEINQRRYGFTTYFDSTVSISQLRHAELLNDLEIPLSVSYRFNKLRVSGGANFIFITQRNSLRYYADAPNSRHASFGVFPRIEIEHFIFPYAAIDYRIYSTAKLTYHIAASTELRAFLGRTISLSLIADLR